MKSLALSLLIVTLALPLQDSSRRLELLCRTWQQIGLKSFVKPYKAIPPGIAKVICFRQDGTYEETMFGLVSKGRWCFNADSTKLAFSLSSFAGSPLGEKAPDVSFARDLIITLTSDTLIIGSEAYYGAEKNYGHDDWYYVPVKE